jgi:phosphopantothenate-cysteine ligase
VLEMLTKSSNDDQFNINPSVMAQTDLTSLLEEYNEIKAKNLLLEVDFISLFDYFALLEFTCKAVSCLGKNALVYLAAAVSDFYIPKSEMSLHKIQSNVSGLTLELKPVPKMIGKLRNEWCPAAYVVTFKLETDTDLLVKKCQQALAKYQHQAVIGNILEDRKNNVVLMKADASLIEINLEREKSLTKNNEIEELIVKYLTRLHSDF